MLIIIMNMRILQFCVYQKLVILDIDTMDTLSIEHHKVPAFLQSTNEKRSYGLR